MQSKHSYLGSTLRAYHVLTFSFCATTVLLWAALDGYSDVEIRPGISRFAPAANFTFALVLIGCSRSPLAALIGSAVFIGYTAYHVGLRFYGVAGCDCISGVNESTILLVSMTLAIWGIYAWVSNRQIRSFPWKSSGFTAAAAAIGLLGANVTGRLDYREKVDVSTSVTWNKSSDVALVKITNLSDKSVNVVSIRTSCGCLSVEPEEFRFDAGRQTRLTVTLKDPDSTAALRLTPLVAEKQLFIPAISLIRETE